MIKMYTTLPIKRLLMIVVFAVMMFFTAPDINADIIFSNFGIDDSNVIGNWFINGSDSVVDIDRGYEFTPLGNDYRLDSFDIAVSLASGANELEVWLMDDVNGVPDSVLETFNIHDQMVSSDDGGSILSVSSSLNPILRADTPYWLIGNAPNPDSAIRWMVYSIDHIMPEATRINQGSWGIVNNTPGSFRVTGTIVPEPVSSILFLAGGAILARRTYTKGRNRR